MWHGPMDEDEDIDAMHFGGGWVGNQREMFERFQRHHMDMFRHMRGRRRRDSEENERKEEIVEEEEKDDKLYFEDLISFPKKLYEKNEDIDNNMNLLSIQEFKKEKINKLKEDIFYYCAPPEILNKLNNTIEDEKSYNIYQNLNAKNFLYSQNMRNKILKDKETKLKSLIKDKNLSNIKELSGKLSNLEGIDKEEKNKQVENCSLITNQIENINYNYKEKNEKEVLEDLDNLVELIKENNISMKFLGYVTYNLFESNLCNLLDSLLQNKFEKSKSKDNIIKFGNILISIKDNIKSIKLLMLIIKFCNCHKDLLNSLKSEQNNKESLVLKGIINFDKLFNEKNIKYKIKVDYNLLWNTEKIKNLNYNNYLSLHYEDNLFVFLNYKNNIKNKEENTKENYENILYYIKINLNEKKVIDHDYIELIKDNEKNEEKILDINISIKNEFIYIFYLTEKSDKKSYLKYKIYNQSTFGLIKEDKINIENSCIQLLNDNKYIYCICKEEDNYKILLIKKSQKIKEIQKYYNLSIYIEKEQLKEKEFLFKMHNCLSINNISILESNEEKYTSYFTKTDKDEYILNIFKLEKNINEENEEKKNIKLSYNNKIFLLTKFDKTGFNYLRSNKENNNLITDGISLLPFNSNNYNNIININKNIYEYLLEEYSSYLNIYGNYDLLNKETEKYLVEGYFVNCCNFKEYILDFFIKNMIKEKDNYEIILYDLIIIKQNICSLYNCGIFDEKKIKNLFSYLKEFIMKNIKEKKKSNLFNKILKEIICILSYINESKIIEIKDVENYINKEFDRTKLLLIELLLEQKSIQINEDLLNILINFDKTYLINAFNAIETNSKEVIKHYSLYNYIISKSNETILIKYFNDEEKLNRLIKMINPLMANMKEIYQKYKNLQDNAYISNYSFLYCSFNFRLFYFIIQNIISKNIFLDNSMQESIKNMFLFFDENNLKKNNIKEYLDLNNIYEIKISSLKDLNDIQEFKFEKYNNILIKTSYNSGNDLNEIINVSLINKKEEKYLLDLNKETNLIFKNIKTIQINYLNNKYELKNEIIIDIIPLKNEENYIKYKKNKDIKLINLIEKSILFYLLNSYNKIQILINEYEKDKLVVNNSKLYQNEIFKYIDIKNKEKYKDNKKTELLIKSNNLIEDINKIMKYEINKNNNEKKSDNNEKEEKIKISKLINYFENYYSKKKNIFLNRKSIQIVKPLIEKIFSIGIKYNNYKNKLEILLNEIKNRNINENEINIEEIESLENFEEMFSLYKESFKMTSIYDIEKNKFIEKEFEEEVKKYIDNINKKLDFIDDVISSKIKKENNILPKISIIENIFILLKQLENIEIQEIIKYSEIQNINCVIILNQMKLIKDLLINTKNEINLSFLLIIMNQKIRMNHNKGRIIFDNIYGANYSNKENLIKEFHEIIKIIYEKNKVGKNKLSNITKYELLECFLWKIKERDFNIIFEMLNIFEDIIYFDKNNNINLENKCSYNIKYFDKENEYERKKEIFEILISQIFNLIKEKIKYKSENNYKDLFEKILNYFAEINNENPYYHDFILLFYKNVFNSVEMFDLILSSKKNIFDKIMNIALSSNKTKENEDINTHTKLIMLKLLYQILSTVKKVQLQITLLNYFKLQNKELKDDSNVFLQLFSLIFTKLNEKNNEGKIIKRYYHQILIICLSELIKESVENIKKLNVKDNNNDILSLLFNEYYIGMIENRYLINSLEEIDFENTLLYNSDKMIINKSGKILCFLDEENSLEKYLEDNSKIDFNKNEFKFFTQYHKNENNQFNGFVLSDDILNSEFFKISSIDYLKNVNLQEYNENNIQKEFIIKNSKLIFNIIIEQFLSLNNKGKYFALKIIEIILKKLNQKDIIQIFQRIYEYYKEKKEKENESQFLSLEFLEEKINILISESNNKNIYLKSNKNDNILKLLNFQIKEKSIGLNFELNDEIKWYNNILNIPINNERDIEDFDKIYADLNFQNISLYKYNYLNEEIKIEEDEDCILFINEINEEDKLDIIKNDKIKAIIIKEIKMKEENLIEFINKNKIPLYKLNDTKDNKLNELFIKDIGGIINKKENILENANIEFIKDDQKGELLKNQEKFYCLGNLKLIKRLIFDILCLDSIEYNDVKNKLNLTDSETMYILEVINLEYYFNIKNNFPNEQLRKKLIKYMNKFNNEWLGKYLDKYIDIKFDNILSYEEYLNQFDINENNKEKDILENNSGNYNNIIYDKLLFVLKNCIKNSCKAELFVEKYFIVINKILENKEKKLKDLNSDNYGYSYEEKEEEINPKNENDYFEDVFAFEAFKILYTYLINNYSEENSKLFKKCFEECEINSKIKKIIEQKIDFDEYLNVKSRDKIDKGKIFLFQFIFIYFDICLLLFFRENEEEYLKYWMKTRHKLFLFYCNYKLLSTEKYYNGKDFKEIFTLIAYTSDSIDCFYHKNISNDSNNENIFNIESNTFTKYINDVKDKKEDEVITSFSVDFNQNQKDFNKLAVFIIDKNNKDTKPKYLLQDVIDIKELSRKRHDYKIKLNSKDIYLVPLKNIKTHLFAFGYNYNNSLGVNGSFAKFYDNPTKCSGKSEYSWNFSYGQNYCISLDEVNNKIYSCGCGKGAGLSSISKKEFIDENNINQKIFEKEKIVDIATGNCTTSMILTEKGNIYAIGKNEFNFLRLPNNNEKTSIKTPLYIEIKKNIKVVSLSVGYKNCFAIDNLGELYGIGDNTRGQILNDLDTKVEEWTKIELPERCKRFLQCANGERYLICLIEDYKGNGKIYARGINKNHECGIKSDEERYVSQFTQCDETSGLNFKSIYTRNNRSAAITIDGKLYIWGQKIITNYINTLNDNDDNDSDRSDRKRKNEDEGQDIPCPTLVQFESNVQNPIIDQVAISNTHLLAIGRVLENGNYVKKLFSCGNNKKGALGLDICSFSDKNMIDKLTEIKIKDNENTNLIPIKLSIGIHRSFVLCIDENELIKEINNKENKENIKYQIKIESFIEESMEEKLKDFYKSDGKLNKYINIFKSLTNQNYIDFVDIMDKLKTNDRILTSNIFYNEFLNYLNKQGNIYDFLMIFGLGLDNKRINEQESESIFNYLKTRMMLVENNLMKFCLINKYSEYKPFLQRIIANNIIYLPNKIRTEKFIELLSEIPRNNEELKTIKVDRFKAKAFYTKYNESYQKFKDIELDETIFGQIFNLLKDRNSKEFFIEKNSRLFRVALTDEHAVDSGGPYHDVISNLCEELQSDYLDILIKTPNNKNNYDLLNDKYIINPNSKRTIYNEAYEFLGKLMASSIATGEALYLNLHPIIWKSILNQDITLYDYESIDYYFYTIINQLEYINKITNKEERQKKLEDYQELYFIIKNSNDIDIELKPNGRDIKVTADNLKEYIELSKSERINEFKNSLEFLKKGFHSVIPYDILQVLTWSQLEEMVCGENKIDINEFRTNTSYEGYKHDDNNIKWFWEWFESTNDEERIKYLKFVSGRSRLPKSSNIASYRHIISKANNEQKNGFPKSMTCFFKLYLPEYDSKEKLIEKMKYAIIYCYEIDNDQ